MAGVFCVWLANWNRANHRTNPVGRPAPALASKPNGLLTTWDPVRHS